MVNDGWMSAWAAISIECRTKLKMNSINSLANERIFCLLCNCRYGHYWLNAAKLIHRALPFYGKNVLNQTNSIQTNEPNRPLSLCRFYQFAAKQNQIHIDCRCVELRCCWVVSRPCTGTQMRTNYIILIFLISICSIRMFIYWCWMDLFSMPMVWRTAGWFDRAANESFLFDLIWHCNVNHIDLSERL